MNAQIFALLLKVSAILGAASFVVLLLSRSSAARRHFVWSTAMTSIVVLVLLQLVVPHIIVPVAEHSPLAVFARSDEFAIAPASGVKASLGTAANDLENGAAVNAPPAIASSGISVARSSRVSAAAIGFAELSGSHIATAPQNAQTTVSSVRAQSTDATPASVNGALLSRLQRPSLRTLLLGAWCIGTLLLLVRLFFAHWHIRRIARSAMAIDTPTVYPDALRLADQLGINGQVQLLTHECVATPSTAGWSRPIILLPVSFAAWSETRQRAVFTHELAHVARGDSLSQTVASVACALFWFHPGCWIASRLLRVESERAADDCVINAGMTPVDYADHLVAIAAFSSSGARVPAVALGMARASQLELRLRAMLNVQQSRRVFTRGAQRVASAVGLMVIVPFAGLQARIELPQPPRTARPAQPATTPPPSQPARLSIPAHVVAPSLPAGLELSAAPAKPAEAQFTLPIAPPTFSGNPIGLPAAPPVTGSNRGAYVRRYPPNAVIAPETPLPAAGIFTPPAPAPAVLPPLPVKPAAAPARDGLVPPLPPRTVGPPLPSREAAPPSPAAVDVPARLEPYTLPRIKPPAYIDTTYERVIDTVVGDTLEMTLPAGGNVTIHGWDEPGARLRAQLGGQYWHETRVMFAPFRRGLQLLAVAQMNGTGVIFSPTEGYVYERQADSVLYVPSTIDNEFELWIPRRMSLKFMAPVGVLSVDGVRGDIQRATTTVGACVTQDGSRWRVKIPRGVRIVDGKITSPKTDPIIVVDGVVESQGCEFI